MGCMYVCRSPLENCEWRTTKHMVGVVANMCAGDGGSVCVQAVSEELGELRNMVVVVVNMRDGVYVCTCGCRR